MKCVKISSIMGMIMTLIGLGFINLNTYACDSGDCVKEEKPLDMTITLPAEFEVFSDFGCGYCQLGADTISSLEKEYGDSVSFKLTMVNVVGGQKHKRAARYVEAIKLIDSTKVVPFYKLVFKNKNKIRDKDKFFMGLAKELGLKPEVVKHKAASKEIRNILRDNKKRFHSEGFGGVPAYKINGMMKVPGYRPFVYFNERILK